MRPDDRWTRSTYVFWPLAQGQTAGTFPLVQAGAFDFLIGTWDVRNRRLDDQRANRRRESWSEFESRVHAWPILGGAGVADSYAFPAFPGRGEVHGFALRLLDAAADLWRIWWAASHPGGRLDPPVVGAFRDGVGSFGGEDRLDGHPILVKTRYSELTPESLRWEQAFSFDRGGSYETNWVMEFRRARSHKGGPARVSEYEPLRRSFG